MEIINHDQPLYVVIESDVLQNKDLTSTAKIAYAYIQFYANNKYGYCFLTEKKLAEKINISVRQLRFIIKDLVKCNYITLIRKNNRLYIMPTINKTINDRKERIQNLKESIFTYDWLNEEDDVESY